MAGGAADLRRPAVLIFFGLYILWGFGFETVGKRLWIVVDGTITSSISVPFRDAPRYATHYIITSDNGHAQAYSAGATDASLQRGLAVGTRLTKHRWDLGYSIDGRWITFPTYFYFPILAGAVFAVGYGVVEYRKRYAAIRAG